MSGWHSRSDIIGPDGLSRLSFGQAVDGERRKGYRHPAEIALNILRLYRDDWLERELGKERCRIPKTDRQVLDAIWALTEKQAA